MTHIKIPDVAPIVRYVTDGIEDTFSYPFPIFASEDLHIYLDGAQQVSGFTINGAGDTAGGTVTFDAAPDTDTIVTLERELSIERLSDFLEGGEFSATSINNELDYIIASLQQVNRENDTMIKYGDHETPGNSDLPDRAIRKNKALGFDGNGNPVAVSLEGSMAAPSFTATGAGAATRTSTDKLSDIVSIKDFGAVGDGLTNDTTAIQNALAAHDNVLIPNGTFLITGTIALENQQSLIGLGQKSIIKCSSNSFDAIEINARGCTVQNLRIENGDNAILLLGRTQECTQNGITDVQMFGCNIGIKLDGATNPSWPCYWNNFTNILIEQFVTHGVHLTLSGAGDTPNANRFHKTRVFSKGVNSSGHGFYVENGAFNNSFIDCEADMDNSTGGACFRLGADSNKTLILNLYTESKQTLTNIQLDSGSIETSIYNLTSNSAGAAILDNSGGEYNAYNAGFPNKNRLQKTTVVDLNATLQRYDTEYIDSTGTVSLDTSHSVHLVSSFGGALTIELPNAADAVGVMMVVKKTDSSGNLVTVTEESGNGPDGRSFDLGAQNDFVQMISNGAQWYVISSNRASGNTRFHDGTGTYDIDMAVDTYLLSSFGGVLTARLPPANAVEAVGRTITIKKTDVSANVITVSEQGGSGPDGFNQPLASQYDAITVVSNGAQWYIVSKF